jgi:DNA topoisomerase-2
MNLFNADDKLTKYESIPEIIDDYYEVRLEYYDDRKEFIIDELERELMILSNKAKYIQEILDNTIDLRKKKKQEIIDMLEDKDYDIIDDDKEYKYLIKMPMDSVSEENVEKLLQEHNKKNEELLLVKSTTIEQMWLSELILLETEYANYRESRIQSQQADIEPVKKKVVKKIIKKAK